MKYLVIVLLLMLGCKTKQETGSSDFVPDFTKGPPTLVYKTKKDYHDLVPVWLSDDKTRIVAYPGLTDIHTATGFPFPADLHKGYLLDNRGINKNAAFLKLTYEEYAKLDSLPSKEVLYGWIIDKDPLTALCDCGNRHVFTDIESQLNTMIDDGSLKKVCHVVK